MKKVGIEIQVIFLTIGIAIAMMIAGALAYRSLSNIVDTIHNEARPDRKLLLIKDISSGLNDVENAVRLYSLSGDVGFLGSVKQMKAGLDAKLDELRALSEQDQLGKQLLDSIGILTASKLQILAEIQALHRGKPNTSEPLKNLYSKVDTVIVEADTIKVKPEERKSFFKRIFSKRDTSKRSIIIDNSQEKIALKTEIADVEKNIVQQTKQLQAKDKRLLEKNIGVTQSLNRLIVRIENAERRRFEQKTREADAMANETYNRIATFIVAAAVLLVLVLVLFFTNLRQNNKYQRYLRKAKADAESLAKAKEMFVATVSHEMRTPVNAIFGLTEQLLKKPNDPTMKTDLEIVQKSAGHLLALVNDTLDFSKIESQKMKLESVDFSLTDLLGEVKAMVSGSAQQKGVGFVLKNGNAADLVLCGDPIRLKQIVINLVTNAIKFTSQGTVEINVSGKELPDSRFGLLVSVTDTGIGIAKDKLPYIFDEFVQVGDNLTQKQRGAGLGLAIVKKLVELHGGTIDVQSTLGRGSTFTFEIPYRKGVLPEEALHQEEPEVPDWFGSLKILVVDDEEFNIHLMRNILQKWNVRFTVAVNGQEAVDWCMKEDFDLILIDIRMPVMDGYQASEKILQHKKSSKIVALTATTHSEEIEKMKACGIQTYLQKPFPEKKLLGLIIDLVDPNELVQAASQTEDAVADLAELRRISGGDEAFFQEMLDIFIRSASDAKSKFEQYLAASDWEQIGETAHKLAAPSKHIKAVALYDLLKELERTAGLGQTGNIAEQVRSINTLIDQVISFISNR